MKELAIECSKHIRAGQGKVVTLTKQYDQMVIGGIMLPESVAENLELSVHGKRPLSKCTIIDSNCEYDLRVGDDWLFYRDSAYTGYTHADMDWIPEGYMIKIFGGYPEELPLKDIFVMKDVQG
jgi:hypothetical protein